MRLYFRFSFSISRDHKSILCVPFTRNVRPGERSNNVKLNFLFLESRPDSRSLPKLQTPLVFGLIGILFLSQVTSLSFIDPLNLSRQNLFCRAYLFALPVQRDSFSSITCTIWHPDLQRSIFFPFCKVWTFPGSYI